MAPCERASPSRLVEPLGPGWMLIVWEDQSSHESDFHLQRRGAGQEWTEVATTAANVVQYLDMNPPCGLVTYRVRAHRHDQSRYSDWSPESTATRSCGEPEPTQVASGLPPGNGPTSTVPIATLTMPTARMNTVS